jgi:hypothetical protein
MGWFKLDGRVIIELVIPASEGCIGEIDKLKLCRLGETEESAEFVVPYLKKEWVREIYTKSPLMSGYGRVQLRPVLLTNRDTLFKTPIHFSGDGYAEPDYGVFNSGSVSMWLCPGLSYEDNLSRAPKDSRARLLLDLFNRHSAKSTMGYTKTAVDVEVEKFWLKHRFKTYHPG